MPNDLTLFHYWVMTVSASSLCVSLVALIISWVNAKRTNASVLRIIEVRGYSCSTAKVKISQRIAVYVKNLGLPLHEARVWLTFIAKDGSGTKQFEMTRYSIDTDQSKSTHSEFPKGMVALFELRSETLDQIVIKWSLDSVERRWYFEVYDSGYLIQSFRIGGWREKVGAIWNRIAFRVNRRFDRTVMTNAGEKMLKSGSVLPTLRRRQWHVDYFVREIKRDYQEKTCAEKDDGHHDNAE